MLKDAFRELSNEIILEWQGGRISKISTQYTNHDFNSPIFFLTDRSLFISWSDCRVLVVSWEKLPDSPPEALWHSYVPLLPISSYLQVGFLQSPPPPSNLLVKTNPHFFPPKNYVIPPPHPPLLAVFIDCSLNAKITFFSTGASTKPPGSGGKRLNIVEPK